MQTTTTPSAAELGLGATLEDLVVFVRRLPVTPHVGLNEASILRACATEGPLRISDIAQRLGVSQPGATQLVDRMAREGWVERYPDPTDRRVVLVRATPTGRSCYEQRRASRAALLVELSDRLPAADRRQLRAIVPVLQRLISLTAEIPHRS